MSDGTVRQSRLALRRARAIGPLAAFLAYLLATVVYTWPLALHPATTAVGFRGDTVLNMYILAWDQHALLHEPWRIFTPNMFFPARDTLALSENMILPAAMALPLAPLGNPVLIYNAVMLGSFALSAWCWWWVLRRWGVGWIAAWVGGALFGFSPWRFAQLGHMQLLLSWWTPLVLLGVDAWLRGGGIRWALFAAAALAAQFYSCVYQFYFTALFLLPFAAIGLPMRAAMGGDADGRENKAHASIGAMALQALVAASVLVACLLPAWGPYHNIRRILFDPNPVSALLDRGASIGDYFRSSHLNWFYGPRQLLEGNPHSAIPWEHLIWPGWTPYLFALLLPAGWWLARSRKVWNEDGGRRLSRIVMLTAGGVFLFGVSLGARIHWRGEPLAASWPYMALHRWLPGFDAIRVPPRASIMVALTLSGLAAFAVDGFLKWSQARWGRAGMASFAALAIVLTAVDLLNRPLPVEGNADYWRHRTVHAALAGQPEGVTLALPLDGTTHLLSALASVEHCFPLVNGSSGYLLRSNGETYDRLREGEWNQSHLDLVRWLGVRYLILDEKRAAETEWPPPVLGRLLAEKGMLEVVQVYPDIRMSVYRLKPTTATLAVEQASNPTEEDFRIDTQLYGASPSLVMYITYKGPHRLLPDDRQPLTWTASGEDASGRRLWKESEQALAPHFLLSGEIFGIPVQVEKNAWAATRHVDLRVRLKGMDVHLKQKMEYAGPNE